MRLRVRRTPVKRTVDRWCDGKKQTTTDAAETIADQIRSFPAAQLRSRVQDAKAGRR